MSVNVNTYNIISQILFSSIDLYLYYKERGVKFDGLQEKELKEKLKLLNNKLKNIPDLPEE